MEYFIDHQLNIMLFLSGICTALAIMVLISRSIPEGRRNALLILEAGCALLLICDRFAYIYRGDVSQTGYIMVRLCNFLVFMFSLNHNRRSVCGHEYSYGHIIPSISFTAIRLKNRIFSKSSILINDGGRSWE